MTPILSDFQCRLVECLDDLEAIAVPLGRICRFAGQVKRFYPVLAHSLVVGDLVKAEFPPFEIYGLLHDCGEAAISDIPTPFKTDEMRELEEAIRRRMFDQLGLAYPDGGRGDVVNDIVASADLMAFWAEVEVLQPSMVAWANQACGWPVEAADADALKFTRLYGTLPIHEWVEATKAPALFARRCKEAMVRLGEFESE